MSQGPPPPPPPHPPRHPTAPRQKSHCETGHVVQAPRGVGFRGLLPTGRGLPAAARRPELLRIRADPDRGVICSCAAMSVGAQRFTGDCWSNSRAITSRICSVSGWRRRLKARHHRAGVERVAFQSWPQVRRTANPVLRPLRSRSCYSDGSSLPYRIGRRRQPSAAHIRLSTTGGAWAGLLEYMGMPGLVIMGQSLSRHRCSRPSQRFSLRKV